MGEDRKRVTGMGIFYIAALTGAASGAAGAAFIKLFGDRMGLIDIPNERSSHTRPTPRGGGVGIFPGYAAASLLLGFLYPVVYPAAAIGLLGFVEDRFSLSSRIRLFLQFLICAAALAMLIRAPAGPIDLTLFFMAALFICGTANFYNFMDGANGMAGLTGVVAFASLAFYSATVAGDAAVTSASIFIALSCAGFLPFNLPKARVFMGDTGSMFLGFLFACFVVRLSADPGAFICAAMFLSLFYADCLLTLVVRRLEGRPLMKAHRHHLYQYLCNELGMAHWKVSLLYAAAQACISVFAIAAYWRGIAWQAAFFIVVSFVFFLVYRAVKELKPRRVHNGRAEGAPSRP